MWYEQAKALRAKGYSYNKISDVLNINLKTVQCRFKRDETKGNYIDTKQGKEELKPKVEDKGSYYIVTSGKYSFSVTKIKLKEIKIHYCETGLEINELCRRLEIPRRDFFILKTAFSITHNDVPALDEEITDDNIDSLIVDSLERRKNNYFLKLQEEEIKQLRKEVMEYRQQDHFIKKIHRLNNEHLDEFVKTYPGPTILLMPKVETHKMLEVPIVDLHLGKLSWEPETGENYDHKIAETRFMSVIYDIVNKVKDMKFEKTLFSIGSDFFNFDTVDGTTTAGTRQDNDVRWQKLYVKGCEILIRGIDILSQFSPVHLILVPGNHDKMTSFYAADKVATWFRNNPNITADVNPKTRKYVEFGKCLIGYTHMDKEKKRIEGNMQIETPEAWGRTLYREWHGGHLHSEQVKEVNGIKIRNLSSVTGTDAWHNESGYVGSLAVNQSFIWDKQNGLESILFSTIRR